MQANTNSGKIDEQKLQDFMLKATGDIASTISAVLVIIGDRLGLYKAMAESGQPITSEELARKTTTNARLIREWLANQAAGGYITYDASNGKYSPIIQIKHLAFFVIPLFSWIHIVNPDGFRRPVLWSQETKALSN